MRLSEVLLVLLSGMLVAAGIVLAMVPFVIPLARDAAASPPAPRGVVVRARCSSAVVQTWGRAVPKRGRSTAKTGRGAETVTFFDRQPYCRTAGRYRTLAGGLAVFAGGSGAAMGIGAAARRRRRVPALDSGAVG